MSGNDSDSKDQDKGELCDLDDEMATLTSDASCSNEETKNEQLSAESKNGKKIGELKKAHLDEITDLRVGKHQQTHIFLLFFFDFYKNVNRISWMN